MSRTPPFFALLVLLAASRLAPAQTSRGAEPPHTNAAIVRSVLDPEMAQVLAVARAMPADRYDFVPTDGRFTGVRSFGDQLKHIAADLYLDGGAILGDSLRGHVVVEEGDPRVRGKAAIIAYVESAVDYMRRAVATIDDANAPVKNPAWLPYGPPSESRLRLAITNLAHTKDHYGQLVEYLRMNGIVPPGSK